MNRRSAFKRSLASLALLLTGKLPGFVQPTRPADPDWAKAPWEESVYLSDMKGKQSLIKRNDL